MSNMRRWWVKRAGVVLGMFMALALVPISASAQPLAPSQLPIASRFSLVLDGYEIASFSAMTGLTSGVEPGPFVHSPTGPILKPLPGATKPATITLKGAVTDSKELWAWHEAVLRGDMAQARRDASIVLYSSDGKPVARYHLEHAWPSKLALGALKAGASAVLTETVTIVAERIERVAP
jgi:phage tail-like protein